MHTLVAGGPHLDTSAELLHLLDHDRPPIPHDRPWVSTNMVMSLDGAYTVRGRSGGLSSTADHALFVAQRSLADVILVGASTVRQERYRRPTVHPDAAEIRERRQQAATPMLVIVSRSLSLPDDLPLLHDDGPPPVLAHPADADTSRAPDGLGLLECGATGVEIRTLLDVLHRRGARAVVCEGGPGLLGQMAATDRIDEYLLSLSPRLVGGHEVGLLAGTTVPDVGFALHRVLRDGDHLMLSYRRE